MVFAPTPPVNQPGATPFSFAAVEALAAAAAGAAGTPTSAPSIALTNPPTTGTVGTVLAITGTVTPNGSPVQVGLSNSATVAPTSWTAATVNGGTWSAIITPSATGTYYIWAEQTNSTGVLAVSAAVTVSAGTGARTITNTYGSTYAWGINPSYAPAETYSSATNGAAAGGTPTTSIPLQFTLSPADATSTDTAHIFWTTTAPTTIPASGESGVTYGGSDNAASLINGGAAIAAYACAPNVAGTYYLSVWLKSSSGTVQGGIVLSPITIT
jgi:hypothetical protein